MRSELGSGRDHSFRLDTTSYKSRDLVYDEPGHRLVVYLEMSGLRTLDWVGCDRDFRRWTEPAGEDIPPEKTAEILRRLDAWAREQRLRIDIGPGIDRETFFAEQEKAGHRVERRPDGSVAVYPKPQGFWGRAIGVTRIYLKRWGM